MEQQTSGKGILCMVCCALCWSLGGVLIKLIPWNGFAIAGVRSLITGMVIATYMRITHIPLCFNRRTIAVAITDVGTYCAFIISTKMTTAANAIVIQYTAPVFVLLYHALFGRQKFRALDWITVFVSFGGVAVCFLDQIGGGSSVGNLIALIAGLFFAGTFITTGCGSESERLSGMMQGQGLAALVGIPFFFATGARLSPLSVGCILLLGIFQLGLASILYSTALKSCSTVACSLIAVLEPLLNPVWVLLVTHERPGIAAIFGGLVTVAMVTVWVIVNDWRKRAEGIPLKTQNGGGI